MREPLILGQSLSRTYSRGGQPIAALVSASFEVHRGDRIAITGPSGCGKSTLLHLMGGLETPTSGTISWPLLGPRDALRPGKVALVFQGPSLLPELTALENVALPLLMGEGEPLTATEALRALRAFDLEALANTLPEAMSGGQMQRVALARAVAGRPALILADEPTGQLDQATRDDVIARLLSHLEGTDTALIVTTHDAAVAKRMARIWSLRAGVLQSKPPALENAA